MKSRLGRTVAHACYNGHGDDDDDDDDEEDQRHRSLRRGSAHGPDQYDVSSSRKSDNIFVIVIFWLDMATIIMVRPADHSIIDFFILRRWFFNEIRPGSIRRNRPKSRVHYGR